MNPVVGQRVEVYKTEGVVEEVLRNGLLITIRMPTGGVIKASRRRRPVTNQIVWKVVGIPTSEIGSAVKFL